MDQPGIDRFFTYVRRRRRLMGVGGATAIVVGALAAVVVGTDAGAVLFGGLAILGLLLMLGSRAGAPLIKEAPNLLRAPASKMQLTTWPYRTSRSLVNNRVLVTLDLPGSANRTPLAEFKPVWYTPGSTDAPTCGADVYGTMSLGGTVLAITEEGNCYLGRVLKTRPAR